MMKVSDHLLEMFTQLGGEIRTGVKIEKILVENNTVKGVKTVIGETIRCPTVVSSAGIHPT